MQVAIISDSHYSVDKVKKLLTHLQSIGIHHLIHAGDFMGKGIEEVLAEFPDITMKIARGNCDYSVMDALAKQNHVEVGDILRFQWEETEFVVSHIPGTAINALRQKSADVVIHGHTHQPRIERHDSALILNPGSLMDGDGFMILELPSLEVDRRFNF